MADEKLTAEEWLNSKYPLSANVTEFTREDAILLMAGFSDQEFNAGVEACKQTLFGIIRENHTRLDDYRTGPPEAAKPDYRKNASVIIERNSALSWARSKLEGLKLPVPE